MIEKIIVGLIFVLYRIKRIEEINLMFRNNTSGYVGVHWNKGMKEMACPN